MGSERGLCGCGCGRATGVYTKTYLKRGQVKGRPKRFVEGHNSRVSGYGRHPDFFRSRVS